MTAENDRHCEERSDEAISLTLIRRGVHLASAAPSAVKHYVGLENPNG
jgi:hypothetical protein